MNSRAYVQTFRIAGFECEVSVPCIEPGAVSAAVVEWSPRVPRFDVEFTPAQRAEYQRRLMEAIAGASS